MARNPPSVDLSPEALLAAYANGAFPMAEPGSGRIHLYTCDPRCVFDLERFALPKATVRALRRSDLVIRCDTAFERVMRSCAAPRRQEDHTWISEAMVHAYCALHGLGHAHSVEAWRGGELVGGLYGVSLGGAFFGESMFVRPDAGGTNASKACLAWLVGRMRERGFRLLDSQFANDHVLSLGAEEIAAADYMRQLREALALDVSLA
ncbi:MAG: leucyl/phenylalanyl-tRNA--protein transferase [Planctomycetes bacterium]|nr:leucyl/phenylalanyl-tRNA--protein transferase [Planctomycetota bacterium]